MVSVSPPVSPSVVARILMIQKPRVIAGTLERTSCAVSRSVILGLPLVHFHVISTNYLIERGIFASGVCYDAQIPWFRDDSSVRHYGGFGGQSKPFRRL